MVGPRGSWRGLEGLKGVKYGLGGLEGLGSWKDPESSERVLTGLKFLEVSWRFLECLGGSLWVKEGLGTTRMAFKGLRGCWRLQGGPGGFRKVWDGLAGSGRIQRGPERSR